MKQDNPLYETFQKVIKKHSKSRNLGALKKEQIGNVLSIGNPGYGKTSGNKREAEIRWSQGHKIFCLYDGGTRMDTAYFMFPSEEPFWAKPKVYNNKIIGKRKYPVELLYPISRNLAKRKKIPNHGIPFTIAVSDLGEDDLKALMGGSQSTDNAITAFNNVRHKINEETTPEDLLNMMAYTIKQSSNDDGIKLTPHGFKKLKTDVFQPLINEGLLSSKKSPTSINIRDLLKRENKNISVLVLRHCPERYWGFLVHFFMKHISDALVGRDEGKRIKRKTTLLLNEIADLLSTDDEKGTSAHTIKTQISKIAKQSRTFDIFLLMDTQLPQELPDIRDTMKRIYVYNSSKSAIDKAMEIIGISTRMGQIDPSTDLQVIPHLDPGWYYLFDREDPLIVSKQVWTRSASWKDGEEFYDKYDSYYGKNSYQDISETIELLRKEREETLQRWRDLKERFTIKKRNEIIENAEEDEEQEEIEEENDIESDQEKIVEEKKPKENSNKKEKEEDSEEQKEEESQEEPEIDWRTYKQMIGIK